MDKYFKEEVPSVRNHHKLLRSSGQFSGLWSVAAGSQSLGQHQEEPSASEVLLIAFDSNDSQVPPKKGVLVFARLDLQNAFQRQPRRA